MPKKTVKVKNVEQLVEISKQKRAEMVKESIEATDWNDIDLYRNMPFADFVEKHFIGMNQNNIRIEHEINRIPFRMEHIRIHLARGQHRLFGKNAGSAMNGQQT